MNLLSIQILNPLLSPCFLLTRSQLRNSGLEEIHEFPTHNYYFVVIFMCVKLINIIFLMLLGQSCPRVILWLYGHSGQLLDGCFLVHVKIHTLWYLSIEMAVDILCSVVYGFILEKSDKKKLTISMRNNNSGSSYTKTSTDLDKMPAVNYNVLVNLRCTPGP